MKCMNIKQKLIQNPLGADPGVWPNAYIPWEISSSSMSAVCDEKDDGDFVMIVDVFVMSTCVFLCIGVKIKYTGYGEKVLKTSSWK